MLIIRDAAGWAARGTAGSVAEIDLTETPEMSANIAVTAVSEATYGAARFAWIQTTTTEEDVAGDELFIDEATELTVCELADAVRCGQLNLAAWHYVMARHDVDDEETDEGDSASSVDARCRSAQGVSFQVEQRDGTGVTLKHATEAADGNATRTLRFAR